VSTDDLTVGTLTANISFGLIESSSKGFEPVGVEGIWGLAYGALSDWQGTPPFFEFVAQDNIYSSFSMCLNTTGGAMDFGVNYQGASGYSWTSIAQPLYYVVNLESMAVNGQNLGFSSSSFGQSFVDSGTTLLYVPQPVYNAFSQALEGMCSSTFLVGICNATSNHTLLSGACVKMTQAELSAFPTVSFTLSGTPALDVSPDAYLYTPDNVVRCMGIQNGGNVTQGTILGDVFMTNFHTVFDIAAKQVGFGPLSSCP